MGNPRKTDKHERIKGIAMQIRKTYKAVSPELLYDEIRDFVLKQEVFIGEAKLETYSIPSDSSSFISRGTLTFMTQDKSSRAGKECFRAHIVGSAKEETKVMFDIDEKRFSREKISALQDDLNFILGLYEAEQATNRKSKMNP
jgi:hypothetical protein